jgi:long-chain acyl-CoA synthetase
MQVKRLFDLLYYQKASYPQPHCISAKEGGQWKHYNTHEVTTIVESLASGLMRKGIKSGDKVAIIGENRPEWNFVDMAIQQLGAVSVPLYPTITIDDYHYIFKHSECKLVFVAGQELFDKASQASKGTAIEAIYTFDLLENALHWKSLLVDEPSEEEIAALEAARDGVREEDLFTIIYTSGTTGKPKGVMLSHRNVMSNIMALQKLLEEDPALERGKFKVLSFLPLCHIFERVGFHCFLYLGGSIYYAESMDTIGENLKEVRPHLFNSVPRLLEKIYDKIVAKGYELSGIKKALFFWALNLGLKYEPFTNQGWWYSWQLKQARKLIFSKWQEALGGNVLRINSGASALQPRLARIFWAAGIPITEAYGLTETSPGISANQPLPGGIKIGTVGMLLDGVEVKIAEDGEILVKGPNVMMGYYKEPVLTAEVMKDGWFHTGDVGEMVDGKFLKITDRKKEMFKTSGGKYVAPQVMENRFKESMLIEQLCVIGDNRRFPAALITPSFENLREWCTRHEIPYTTDEQMIKNQKVIDKFQSEIDRFNEQFGQWERVKKFALLPQAWGIDSGELTPTLKLKRRVINDKYAAEIEALYA